MRGDGGRCRALAACVRLVGAAALFFLMASACGMAALLLLSTLLGAAAAVLLPSLLRCAQLKHVPDGLQPKTLLIHFTRVTPYFGATLQNDDDLTVPRMMMLCGFVLFFDGSFEEHETKNIML